MYSMYKSPDIQDHKIEVTRNDIDIVLNLLQKFDTPPLEYIFCT